MASDDLLKLAECICSEELDIELDPFSTLGVQFAVWMVSDDVSLEEMFAGIDDAEGALGEVFGGEFGDLIGEEMGGMMEMMVSFLQEPAEDWLNRCDIDLSK
jgi:hypothetical protein